jgi:hypothetical protein
MTAISLRGNRNGGGGSGEARPVLPTDNYRMKIVEAKLEEDNYGKVNKDGTKEEKFVVVWEMSVLTEDQQEAEAEAEEDWSTVRIWSRFAPYYGDVRAGGPSKLKEFIDGLREQGLLPNFDPDSLEPESLVGIEQRVSVVRYIKTMGPSAGQPGNKPSAYSPVRQPKKAKTAAPAPQPVAVEADEDGDIPF